MSRAPSRSHDSTTARDITHQQERSSLQMSPRNLAPKSKSKEFTGFAGEIPPRLQPSEAKNVAKRSEQGGTLSKRSSLFSWLEYPPNFEKATECRIQSLKQKINICAVTESIPSELKYTLARNFGFFSSIFTQFFDRDGAKNVQHSLGLGK